jgi:hypothetical protein
VQGFHNIGEASRYLFDTQMRTRAFPCGCGLPAPECPIWKNTISRVSLEMAASGTRLVRMRRFASILTRSKKLQLSADEQAIVSAMAAVYAEIAERSGCQVIVDSSKHPTNALLVSMMPDAEVHVLHLVRDAESMVSSCKKSKGYLRAHPAHKVVMFWWASNVLSERLRGRAHSYQRVLYEDFVRDPGRLLREITSAVTGSAMPTPFLRGNTATFGLQHDLAGNPDKLVAREVTISEKKSANVLPYATKWAVGLLTFPLQFRYGCLGNRARMIKSN